MRRRVVDLLRERPRSSGDLARETGLSAPTMSRHLRTLRESGLVEESHPPFDARVRIYTLRAGPIAELTAWLEASEALWSDQLRAFQQHIDAKADL